MEQPELNELYTKFAAHEVQCEERWKTIFARLERMDAKMDTRFYWSNWNCNFIFRRNYCNAT